MPIRPIYLDDLFNAGQDHDWAIIGAGVLPSDAAMRDKLAAQDFLTTVVEQDNNKTAARVTGADDRHPAGRRCRRRSSPSSPIPMIRIVSMTITEGGYFIDASGTFNPDASGDRRGWPEPGRAEDGLRP